MSVLENVEPKLMWKHFDELRKIPRPSGDEEAAAEYVISVAKKLDLEYDKDDTGNVLVKKPGSPGHETAPAVALQSHLDMVCEKNSDKEFDFDKDAIQLLREGDWLTADGTTLGADNGIGVATILAIFEDDSLIHPPLEGLFTVDEERGLVGAMTVSPEWLEARKMINLDSEEIGVFSIGCAGGRDTNISLPINRAKSKKDTLVSIHLTGLRGGHSGIDIHEGRGNAVKILNRLLYQVNETIPVEMVSLKGGDKHNAIPREAFADIAVESGNLAELKNWFDKAFQDIKKEFQPVEQNIKLNVKESSDPLPEVIDKESQKRLAALLFALPHGPLAMSRSIKDLVETSNNVAAVKTENDSVNILCSSRSSNMEALQATLDKLIAISELAGASVKQPPGYPGWMPDLDSEILKVALETYRKVAGEAAKYEAIHAGLECGLVGEKFPGMDMISVGPTLKHPHSPDERVHIGTVKTYYNHVLKMLEVLA